MYNSSKIDITWSVATEGEVGGGPIDSKPEDFTFVKLYSMNAPVCVLILA